MQCDECGFDYDSVGASDAPTKIRAFGRRYRAPLTRFLRGEDGDSLLRTRADPAVWSALEYAAHVRDVFAWNNECVRRSLSEDRPAFERFDADEVAAAGLYNQTDPVAVADALAANAEQLAVTFEAVDDDQWDCVHIRGGEDATVLFSAQRAVHEGGHHLLDIGRVMRALRTARAESASGAAEAQ